MLSAKELPIITRVLGGNSRRYLKTEENTYAVIETGGKQHRIVEGELIKVEKIEAETGSTIDFDRVLMVGEGESIKVGGADQRLRRCKSFCRGGSAWPWRKK